MFVDGIKLFCFGASYTVALLAELAAPFLPAGLRRKVSLSFSAAGILAHTIYIGHRATHASESPLATSFDSLLILCWVLAVAYLTIQWHNPRLSLGVFALPVIVLPALVLVAGLSVYLRRRD